MHLRCAPLSCVSLVHLLLISSLAINSIADYIETRQIGFEQNDYRYPVETPPVDIDKKDHIDEMRWNGGDKDNYEKVEASPDDKSGQQFHDNNNAMEFDSIVNEDFLKSFSSAEDDHVISRNDFTTSEDSASSGSGLKSRNNRNRLTHNMEMLNSLLELYKLQSNSSLSKRGEGPQLSIVNPLDVLRQRLLLELARRRMKENQDQINANAEILKKIGKRSIPETNLINNNHIRKRLVRNELSLPSNLLSKHGRRKTIGSIKTATES